MAEQSNITKLAYGLNNESFASLTSWHIKYVYLELENHPVRFKLRYYALITFFNNKKHP